MATLDRYVSTTGNDSNDGLASGDANAWLTIDKALTAAETLAAADEVIIHVAAGAYAELNKVIGGPGVFTIHWNCTRRVTVQYDGAAASDVSILCSNSYNDIDNTVMGSTANGDCSNITFHNVSFTAAVGSRYPLTLSTDDYSAAAMSMTGMRFENCRFVAGDSVTAQAAVYMDLNAAVTSIDVEFVDCTYVGRSDAPAGSSVIECVEGAGTDGVDRLIFKGGTIDCDGGVNNDGITIGIDVGELYVGGGLETINCVNVPAWIGISRASGHAGNTIVGMVEGGRFATTYNHGLGIGSTSTTSALVVQGNYCQSTGHSFLFRGARNAVVENNHIVHLANTTNALVLFKGAADCEFNNNLLWGMATYVIDNDDGAGAGEYENSNNTAKNNIVITARTDVGRIFAWTANKDAGGNVFGNNVYDTSRSAVADAWTLGFDVPATDVGSIEALAELDALNIPVAGGNCDVGRGDTSARPSLGPLDFYGRPKLQNADCIGAVYPQRHSLENVLLPRVQYPSEVL